MVPGLDAQHDMVVIEALFMLPIFTFSQYLCYWIQARSHSTWFTRYKIPIFIWVGKFSIILSPLFIFPGGAHGHTHGISGNHTNTNKSEWHKLESTEAVTNEDVENGVSVQQPLQNETTSHSPEDILEVNINRREEQMREKCEKGETLLKFKSASSVNALTDHNCGLFVPPPSPPSWSPHVRNALT